MQIPNPTTGEPLSGDCFEPADIVRLENRGIAIVAVEELSAEKQRFYGTTRGYVLSIQAGKIELRHTVAYAEIHRIALGGSLRVGVVTV